MTVTEGKQELIAFVCVYYAKGMLDDKEYEALKLAIRSLEAWESVKKEIEKINLYYCDYENNVCSESGKEIKYKCLGIIDKYLSEVGNED